MTTAILTVIDFIIIVCLVAGWYFKPLLLQDAVNWCKSTVTKATDYFKK